MKLKMALKVCLIVAIETIFCFTPLGTIPIGPIAATLAMIPVIISSLTFGKTVGLFMGFVFGLYSFIYWTFIMPAFPTAFIFTPFAQAAMYKGNFGSVIICFIPRMIAGLSPALISGKFKNKNKIIGDILGAAVGSMSNTILVMLFIFLFFGKEYQTIYDKSLLAILGITVLTNGIPELVIAVVTCPIVAKILRKI